MRKNEKFLSQEGWMSSLFGLSVIGVALASFVSLILLSQTDVLQGGLRKVFILFAVLLMGYAVLALVQAWRLARQRMASMRETLAELKKARNRAEEASQEKSRLLATITHELRTPMNGVIGMAALLRDTPLSEEQTTYVRAIERSGRALLSIIDELLDSSRLEAGEFEIAHAPFELARMVEETAELLSPRAHAKDIDMACFIDPALPDMVSGDAARIRQVLINLAGNAIKFTDEGGVLIRVTAAGPERVRFEVADSGAGIARDEQERIFRPYQQAGDASRRKGGTGLGLTISARLVERMGGKLELSSERGKGATFGFALPLETARRKDAQEAARPSLGGAKILLAVSEGPKRRALEDYIMESGGKFGILHGPAELERALRELDGKEGTEIICDAGFAPILRKALERGLPAGARSRLWLLLRPEERRRMKDLMEADLAGFLLSPLRRATFFYQLVERRLEERLERSAKTLRESLKPGRSRQGRGPLPLALLVEDNAINAMLARAMLKKAGFALTHVENGAAALDYMSQALEAGGKAPAMPKLILMDVHMPKMDGLETTQRIRAVEKRAGGGHIPILALTASAGKDERDRCLAAGMDGFLGKPFDLADLTEAIGKVVKGYRAA